MDAVSLFFGGKKKTILEIHARKMQVTILDCANTAENNLTQQQDLFKTKKKKRKVGT